MATYVLGVVFVCHAHQPLLYITLRLYCTPFLHGVFSKRLLPHDAQLAPVLGSLRNANTSCRRGVLTPLRTGVEPRRGAREPPGLSELGESAPLAPFIRVHGTK